MSFVWSNNCEEIFQNLNILLTTTLILSLLVEGKDFIVFYDALHLGFDVMLIQDWNVIVHTLRWSPIRKNYLTNEFKFVAVVFALKIWRHYFYGVNYKVFIDHHNL